MNQFLALEKKYQKICVFIVVIFIISCGYYIGVLTKKNIFKSTTKSEIISTESNKAISEKQKVTINIKGAVKSPGIYEFTEENRVNDAVKKAIPLDNADLEPLNLAMFLKDEQDIYIPYLDENGGSNEKEDNLVSINNASQNELEMVPGIGPVMAKNIINQRKIIGRFQNIDDLMNISGIGEKTLEKMRAYIKL
ncbi:MAG: helix-hairpin-helix domain-containing protein [Firmicutes bacterium]|nr:helix-hairpin-helix domain-containing protein [Bacillota bacterium]